MKCSSFDFLPKINIFFYSQQRNSYPLPSFINKYPALKRFFFRFTFLNHAQMKQLSNISTSTIKKLMKKKPIIIFDFLNKFIFTYNVCIKKGQFYIQLSIPLVSDWYLTPLIYQRLLPIHKIMASYIFYCNHKIPPYFYGTEMWPFKTTHIHCLTTFALWYEASYF